MIDVSNITTSNEFWKSPEIKSFFPLTFPKGGVWETIQATCGTCHGKIPHHSFRGKVAPNIDLSSYRGGNDGYIIVGYGYCSKCNIYNYIHLILKSNFSWVQTTSDGNQIIGQSESVRKGWFKRMLGF